MSPLGEVRGGLCVGAGKEWGHRTLGDQQLEPQGARLGHRCWGRGWEDGRLEGQEVTGVEDTANIKPEVQVQGREEKTQSQHIWLTR